MSDEKIMLFQENIYLGFFQWQAVINSWVLNWFLVLFIEYITEDEVSAREVPTPDPSSEMVEEEEEEEVEEEPEPEPEPTQEELDKLDKLRKVYKNYLIIHTVCRTYKHRSIHYYLN